ncbi:hypothetical protein LXA43DRAFT_1038132 [Ganoderma leucocontextum]|nr:hypothetical protein LXA43DRAFT_1038132 [Ganoderma leucocontextum]
MSSLTLSPRTGAHRRPRDATQPVLKLRSWAPPFALLPRRSLPRRAMNRREKLQQASLFETFPNGSVVIIHPGCDAALFSFPAFPQLHPTNGPNKPYGVPPCLVLDACRALTNYAAKNGQDFFARDRAGKEQVPIQVDRVDILGAGCYYYFLGPPANAANVRYPIVKEFAALSFPHDIPRHWSRAAISASSANPLLVMGREQYPDGPNDTPYGVDVATLVPLTEVDWFNANKMYQYVPNIENASNMITLRVDIRDVFYKHGFVFYPTGDGTFVVYFLDTAHLDYAAELHRRPVSMHVEVSDQLIYASFAYAVVSLPRCEDLFDAVPLSDAVLREQAKRDLAAHNLGLDFDELVRQGYGPDLMKIFETVMEPYGGLAILDDLDPDDLSPEALEKALKSRIGDA